jgi:glycine cleavage system regulatory protein
MKMKLLVTVVGHDRPGLVKLVSDTIKQQNGNWLESRLSHLGGKFSGLVLAEFDSEHTDSAIKALSQLSHDGLTVTCEAVAPQTRSEQMNIQLVGNDKPGIVYEVAGAINALNGNVEQFSSKVESAPMSGGELFKATLSISLPEGTTFQDVKNHLESMADEWMVDLVIDKEAD